MKSIAILLLHIILVFLVRGQEEKTALSINVMEKSLWNGSVEIVTELFPWHVAILRIKKDSLMFLCSGTAVQSEFIITAAKCVVPVSTKNLRVLITPKNVHKLPFRPYKNRNEIFKVTKKYYRHNSDGLVLEKDLSILKLQELSPLMSTRLTTLVPTDIFSKTCFTLAWGLHSMMNPFEGTCLRVSIQRRVKFPLEEDMFQNDLALSRALNMRNKLGLSSMFIIKIGQMFNLSSFIYHQPFEGSTSQEKTCQSDEIAHRTLDYLSVKHHYKCLCCDKTQVYLYSRFAGHLTRQVDIGSPVFCKARREEGLDRRSGIHVSEYVLTGIITNKDLGNIPLFDEDSLINFMKATSLDSYAELLYALIETKD